MKRLSDLEVAEVSLVPRGANKKKFLIFKQWKLEKGGPGSGPSGGGSKSQQHAANRAANLGRQNEASAKFTRQSNAIRAGQQRAHASRLEDKSVRETSRARANRRMGKSIMKSHDQEIRNLINSVDPETMKRVDRVLKTMTTSKMKKFKAEEGTDSVGKDKGGDMMPGKESSAYKSKFGKGKFGKAKEETCKDDEGGEDVEMADHQEMGEGEDSGQVPLSERAQAAVKAISRIAAPFKDELNGDHIQAALKEVGFQPGAEKQEQDEASPSDEDVHMSWAIPENVEDEHHATALDMARKSYKDHLEKMGYRKYPDPSTDESNGLEKSKHGVDEDDDEDEEEEENVGKVAKSLDLSSFPKAQRDSVEFIFKANQELVKKAADLEKELKVERDIRKQKEFESKAKEFRHLGANSAELASVMKSMSEQLDGKSFGQIERILKAADNQIGAGPTLYRQVGSSVAKGEGSDAEARLDVLVDSVVQKSEGKKTRDMIYDEVVQTAEGKKLFQEAMTEHSDRIRRMRA